MPSIYCFLQQLPQRRRSDSPTLFFSPGTWHEHISANEKRRGAHSATRELHKMASKLIRQGCFFVKQLYVRVT